jgi:hypothetical protein
MNIQDARRSRLNVGVDMPIAAEAPEPWVKASIDSLKQFGFKIQHNKAPTANALNLDVRLIRAYTWISALRANAMVAIEVDITSPQGSITEKYRAYDSVEKISMFNPKSEHIAALNLAANSMAIRLAESLHKQCSVAKLAAQ